MNILQIEIERGRDDLPVMHVHVGASLRATFELLRPRWNRWHWWNRDRTYRGVVARTIMIPVAAVDVEWWGREKAAQQ